MKSSDRKRNSGNTVDAAFEAVWPLGKLAAKPVDHCPAIVDLNGKTVCGLWDGVFRGDEIYPILRAELRKQFPGVKIVDYKTMGNTHDTNEREYVTNLPVLLRQHGAHAVGMHVVLAYHADELAVQRVHHRFRLIRVAHIGDFAFNVKAMGMNAGAAAPGVDEISLGVADEHQRRILLLLLALQVLRLGDVDAVLRIACDRGRPTLLRQAL